MSSRTRYYNRYRPYRSIGGRAARQQRAADQQRDSTTVVINTNYSFDCGQTMNEIYATNDNSGWFDTGCAAINIYDMLRKSDYFQQFANLYDQFKLDNVRAKIIATNWATSKEESNSEKINEIIKARSYVIVTAWDRSGLSKEQIVFSDQWNDAVPESKKFYTKLGKQITSYSSAKTKHLGPGNAYEIVRQLYPESNYERQQFISTSLLKTQQIRVNTEYFAYNCFYKKATPTVENPYAYEYKSYDFDTKYPTNLIADPSCPFKPTLLVDVISGPNPDVYTYKEKDPEGFSTILNVGVNKIKPVTFDVEFEMSVTFRGLRYKKQIDKVVEYIPPEVKPKYDNNNTNSNEFARIIQIDVDDSKYKNAVKLKAQYAYGTYIERDPLPAATQSRYVVYLDDDPTPLDWEHPNNRQLGVYIRNYANNGFQFQCSGHQILLMVFESDPYVENGNGDNYINIAFWNHNDETNEDEKCLWYSGKFNIPPIDPNNIQPTRLFTFSVNYEFKWDEDEQ